MFGAPGPWYNQTITKYNAAVGSIINNIYIQRFDDTGAVTQTIRVPLHYAIKDKMIARVETQPTLDRAFAVDLPVISYEYVGLNYAPDRKIGSMQRTVAKIPTDYNKMKYMWTPVPYDFGYRIYIYTLDMEDGHKIIEQILPFFTPDYTVNLELVPDMNDWRDVPIVLKNVTFQDMMSEDFKTRRMLIWTIDLTLHGWLFGPVKEKPVIKVITLNQHLATFVPGANTADITTIDNSNSPISGTTTEVPGLTANGQPTTDPALTLPYSQIPVDSNFDVIVTYANAVDEHPAANSSSSNTTPVVSPPSAIAPSI